MLTIAQASDRHGVDVDPHLDQQATIPICDGLQRQGDVIVIPNAMVPGPRHHRSSMQLVDQRGVSVVRGEAGGNTHLLLAAADGVWWQAVDDGLTVGLLTVDPGAVAYLAHPEHGFAGIASGIYLVRRQREQADEIRLVAD